MSNLLLIAFFCLVRAACASAPVVAGGFYLNQQPTSVERACAIMFNPESFHELPSLSVVGVLDPPDFDMLLQSTTNQMHRLADLEHGLWDEWATALQLDGKHPAYHQCVALYVHLMGTVAFRVIPTNPEDLTGCQTVADRVREQLCTIT